MDVNRIIKIDELEVGDEFITTSNGQFRYYRVLRKPKLTHKVSRYSNGALVDKWSGTKCSTRIEEYEQIHSKGTQYERNVIKTRYLCTPDDHNEELSVYGISYKAMWLVKRDI